MKVDIEKILNEWCENKGVQKKEIVNYFGLTAPGFYQKFTRNRFYFHDIEKMAEFFGVSVIEFLQGVKSLKSYVNDPPGLYINSKTKEVEALKNEVAYLKKIVELYEKKSAR